MSKIYWHIQMNLPDGRGGQVIDSKKMLQESTPIIGTGEWDDNQCKQFKGEVSTGLKIGDVILVREGKTVIALCEVIGENFTDANLTSKYINENFRQVKILDWYSGVDYFPQPQGTLQRLLDSEKDSWIFINNLYNQYIKMDTIQKGIELLKMKGQIILQGSPGTGKTYTAKDIAEKIILDSVTEDKEIQKAKLDKSEQFKLVQFHPSFSYDDFVRGIVATSNDGDIAYETKEKLFGKFLEIANKNYTDSKRSVVELTNEEWVINNYELFIEGIRKHLDTNPKYELNSTAYVFQAEADAVRYNGDNWPHKNGLRMKSADIIKLYLLNIKDRQNIIKETSVSSLARDHATYFKLMLDKFYDFMADKRKTDDIIEQIKEVPYVLIIDEINRANLPSVLGELIYGLEYRNQSIETMYEIDGSNKITVPSNLFIVGTMNTADRSVGHIDYAIRRRFAFIDVLPNDAVISNAKAKALFNKVKMLFVNGKIAPEFEDKEVQIGHSYFIVKNDEELILKLEYEIKPILREYLKDGILMPETKTEIEQLSV